MRFCFVVHRAAPFPGGTEVFMQAMAEEALARGHSATILAGQHQGDLNGVTVTSDMSVLDQPFDMIVVHGSGNGPPRRVLDSAATLPSPVLYMLVAHYRHHIRAAHLHDATLLGWSTPMDQQIIARIILCSNGKSFLSSGTEQVKVCAHRHQKNFFSFRTTPYRQHF